MNQITPPPLPATLADLDMNQIAPPPLPASAAGLSLVPPPLPVAAPKADRNMWKEDLQAGLLAAQQGFIGVAQAAPAIRDASAGDNYGGAVQQGEYADQWSQEADALELELPNLPDDETRAYVTEQIAELRAKSEQTRIGATTESSTDFQEGLDARAASGRENLIEATGEINEIGSRMPAPDPRTQEFHESEGFVDGVLNFLSEPGAVTREAVLRSLPAMAPTIAATVGGGIAAGPVGAAAGGGSTGFATEYAMSVSEGLQTALRDAQVDANDPGAVGAFFDANPELFDEILKDAAVRGTVIGATDAVSGGTAGKIAKGLSGASKTKKLGGVTLGAGVEAAGEGAGEAGAQLATTGEINAPEVIAEVIAGGVMGGPQVAAQTAGIALKPSGKPKAETQENEDGGTLTPPPLPADANALSADPATPAPTPPPNAQPESPDSSGDYEPVAPLGQYDPTPPDAVDANPKAHPLPTTKVRAEVTHPTPVGTDEDIARVTKDLPAGDSPAQMQVVLDRLDAEVGTSEPTDLEKVDDYHRVRKLRDAVKSIVEHTKNYNLASFEKGGTVIGDGVPDWVGSYIGETLRGVGVDLKTEVFAGDQVPSGHRMAGHSQLGQFQPGGNAEGGFGFVPGTPGVSGASGVILLNPDLMAKGRKKTEQLEVIAHEVGHMLQNVLFDQASVEEKMAIAAAFNEWRNTASPSYARSSKDGRATQLATARRAGAGTSSPVEAPARTTESRDYKEGFHEWWADATSRSLSTNEVATSVLDKFFARIGKVWRALADMMRKQGYPVPAVDEFYRRAFAKAEETRQSAEEMLPGALPDGPLADVSSESGTTTQPDRPQTPKKPAKTGLTTPFDEPEGLDAEPTEDGTADADEADNAADDAEKETAPDEAPVEDADETRAPKGPLTPGMHNVAFTVRGSMYEQAYRDAGFDPDEAVLFPPRKKAQILKKLLQDRFGILVDVTGDGKRLKDNDLIDQMLDAYRNVQFMLHALGLPLETLGLKGTLTLRLEKFLGRYLGAYYPGDKTIAMPGRSNSFAHEWMHALDHHLSLDLGADAMLSQLTRSDGLNPNDDMQSAFINLINRLFFDENEVAIKAMQLENEASAVHKSGSKKGQPTKAALDAQKKLDRLLAGATRMKIKPSKFREDSNDYAPQAAGYYGSVHEMIARAFEAYIGHKIENLGGTSEFITKGDEAYLSNADRRLAMTFPKAHDRVQIFAAFDALFDQLAARELARTGDSPAARPEDLDIVDPAYWAKMGLDMGDPGILKALTEEARALGNKIKTLISQSPLASLKNTVSTLALNAGIARKTDEKWGAYAARARTRMADAGRLLTNSVRGFAKAILARQPGDARLFLQYLMDQTMTDPGTDRKIKQTFEEFREQTTNAAATDLTNMLKSAGIKNLNPTDHQKKQLRQLLLGQKVPEADAAMVKIAAGMRRIMDKAYRTAVAAGIEMGFVSDTGYVPRTLVNSRVHEKPKEFVAAATKLYRVVFDQITADMAPADLIALASGVSKRKEPMATVARGPFARQIKALKAAIKARAKAVKAGDDTAVDAADAEIETATEELSEAVRDPYAETAADDWKGRIVAGNSLTFDSLGPDASFTKARSLPKEADQIMAEFYEQDPILSVLNYVHGTAGRAAYQERFGKTGGTDKIDTILRRESVQDAIRANPKKYNPKTPKGRLAILRDLANHRTDDIKEMAVWEAQDNGAIAEDIETLRTMIEEITGRGRKNSLRQSDRWSGWLYMLGHVTFLPRAAWTSIAEPITFLMRTGDVKNSARMMGYYAREAARGAKSVQELKALAEMVGVVSTPLHDTVLLNRMSGDFGNVVSGNTVLARFFRANWLSQLTNAQRRAGVAAGTYFMKGLGEQIQNAANDKTGADIARAELAELGVPEDQMVDFAKWLAGLDGLPSLDDISTPAGQLYGAAVARLVDQTIQNPRRADKPLLASNPVGRLAYALMSFAFTYYRNVHLATLNRTKRNAKIAKDNGESRMAQMWEGSLPLAMTTAGFVAMFAGQLMVSVAREAIFNAEQWEKKKDDEELDAWLAAIAFSRTGFMGPADPVLNALTGLRYERDLSNIFVGAYPASVMSHTQNMVKGLPTGELWPGGPGVGLRNSPNSNTAERTAAKSLYRLMLAPAANILLSAVPVAGPFTNMSRYATMQYLSSSSMAAKFADTTVGEENKKKPARK